MKNDPRVGHAPGTVEEALSWLNRMAHGEPEMHLVSLRAAVGFVQREIDWLRLALETATRERDEAREKLVGVNVLKCLLVDAEKARDEAQSRNDERRSGNLIFMSQIHSALDRAEPSNHNAGILNRIIRMVDRVLAAEGERDAIHNGLDVLLGRFDGVIRARADGIGVRDEGGTTVIELPSLPWPDAVAAVIEHLERQGAVIKESLKTSAPPADAATEAVEKLRPRPPHEWHEDFGEALWFVLPIREAPYCGSPLADDWPFGEDGDDEGATWPALTEGQSLVWVPVEPIARLVEASLSPAPAPSAKEMR